jgi:aryl-alcohol dehydrogenase-like predicted oxidoreductase
MPCLDTLPARRLCRPSTVVHIDALQIEYSPWYTDHEKNGLIDTAKELGVAIVAFSPIGKGMLTGQYRKPCDFPENDFRRTVPRFSEENFPKNLRIVDEFQKLAAKKGCTGSQLASAWVIRQGAIPIPGTKTSSRLEENWDATNIDLTDDEEAELRRLVNDAKPTGDR